MSKWMKLVGTLMVAALAALGTAGTTLAAGDDTYIYGLVYIDSNLNGVWDAGEAGYTGVPTSYWEDDEYIEEYVGATVTFDGGDPSTAIKLTSSAPSTFSANLIDSGQELCTYQDALTVDGGDDDDDADLNASPSRPCYGSFGLRPAGDNGQVWLVTITVPEGYVATSATSQYVTVSSDGISPVDFGIAPIGAGGDTTATVQTVAAEAAPTVTLLPETGASLPGLAAVAILASAGAVGLGKRLRE